MERDVAFSLAGINRYAGHSTVRWGVAIHSVVVSRLIEKMTRDRDSAVAGLMHDAHEAVIGDIPTPVARAIDYDKVEAVKSEVQRAIEARLKIHPYQSMNANLGVIKLADVAALHVEKQLFMVPEPQPWGYKPPSSEWAQAAYTIMMEIISTNSHEDGGFAEFCFEYDRLITSGQKVKKGE